MGIQISLIGSTNPSLRPFVRTKPPQFLLRPISIWTEPFLCVRLLGVVLFLHRGRQFVNADRQAGRRRRRRRLISFILLWWLRGSFMYEGTLSLHCLSLSSVKAGSSDLIRGLIFNEGSQRRTGGRAATGLLICARWPSRRQTKTEERERLQLDSSGGSSFVSVATVATTTLTPPCFPPSYQSGQLSR